MLGDISRVDHIYLACGYTDLRRGIDGLAQIVQQQFELDPVFQQPVFVLRQTAGSNQGPAVGGGWLCSAV